MSILYGLRSRNLAVFPPVLRSDGRRGPFTVAATRGPGGPRFRLNISYFCRSKISHSGPVAIPPDAVPEMADLAELRANGLAHRRRCSCRAHCARPPFMGKAPGAREARSDEASGMAGRLEVYELCMHGKGNNKHRKIHLRTVTNDYLINHNRKISGRVNSQAYSVGRGHNLLSLSVVHL